MIKCIFCKKEFEDKIGDEVCTPCFNEHWETIIDPVEQQLIKLEKKVDNIITYLKAKLE